MLVPTLFAALLAGTPIVPTPLAEQVAALDTQVFAAYNRCDLATFRRYFIPGVAFDRDTVVANTRRYICGKVRRELLPASLHVYPIKDYGAIEEGEHRFCELATGRCDGIAKFVIVWARRGVRWRITDVLSYGHRAMSDDERASTANR